MTYYYPFVTGFTHHGSPPLPIILPPSRPTYTIYTPSSPPNSISSIRQDRPLSCFYPSSSASKPYTIYANPPAVNASSDAISTKSKKSSRRPRSSSRCRDHHQKSHRSRHHRHQEEDNSSCHVIHQTAILGSRRYVSETLLFNDAMSSRNGTPNVTPTSSPANHPTALPHSSQSRIRETIALLDGSIQTLLPKQFSPLPCYQPHLFCVSMTNGKGMGMFASQPIPVGTRIVAERPLVVSPLKLSSCSSLGELYRAWWEMKLVGDSTRRRLKRMDNDVGLGIHEHDQHIADAELIPRVMASNRIVISMADSQDASLDESSWHKAVFETISRCNHSCSPNAAIRWDNDTFSLTLKAVRPINMGEEITIGYHHTPLLHSRRERRRQLKSLYGFTCLCPSCSGFSRDYCGSTALLHAESGTEQGWSHSDGNRSELATIYHDLEGGAKFPAGGSLPSFQEWMEEKDETTGHGVYPSVLLISAHARALQIIEEEGLAVLGRKKHVDAIAMCYGALGDVEMFRTWIQQCIDCRNELIEKGCAGHGQGTGRIAGSGLGLDTGYPVHPSSGYVGSAGYANYVNGEGSDSGASDDGGGVFVDEVDANLMQEVDVMKRWLNDPEVFPAWSKRRSARKHHHHHKKSRSEGAGTLKSESHSRRISSSL